MQSRERNEQNWVVVQTVTQMTRLLEIRGSLDPSSCNASPLLKHLDRCVVWASVLLMNWSSVSKQNFRCYQIHKDLMEFGGDFNGICGVWGGPQGFLNHFSGSFQKFRVFWAQPHVSLRRKSLFIETRVENGRWDFAFSGFAVDIYYQTQHKTRNLYYRRTLW